MGPLSCLFVCNVGVLQPNGWMDQDTTGTEICLGPGHIVLDGDPAPLTERDTGTTAPTFRPTFLWQHRPSQQLLSSFSSY